ncbi:methionine--tRNA ligase [Gammaproteobacteria bacterium]|nr:methionine--tRNA ligase [Gammaproteobacteria bacterium]
MAAKKLVTYALPYANGQLHLGHMLGMIQSDVYVRSLRMQGEDVLYVCGDDAHGTPIMLNAQRQGITPEELIEKMSIDHQKDIHSFGINFDFYGSTHDDLNTQLVHAVYQRLDDANMLTQAKIEQAYDDSEQMFLPDRFVKGTCPKCGAKEQYGDHCEVCGKTYALKELIDPISIVSGQVPVWRQSSHVFYRLSADQEGAKQWLDTSDVQSSIRNKLSEWFVDGLQNWDITRDAPYFGIKIPNREQQYFYVWLDAPFGYMTSFARALSLQEVSAIFEQWNAYEVEHFIGKDIVYFHGIFWPSVLRSAKLKPPVKMHVHGFVTLESQKMSKSRGHFISPKAFIKYLPSDMMRYYLASRLALGVVDIDIDWEDFRLKVNADLVGKLANLCSRTQGFIHKYHEGHLDKQVDEAFWQELIAKHSEIEEAYRSLNIAQAVKLVMLQCDLANQYVDAHKPWQLVKEGKVEEAVLVSTTALNAFRYLMSALAPIMPETATRVQTAFKDELGFALRPIVEQKIEKFSHVFSRVTVEDIEALLADQ